MNELQVKADIWLLKAYTPKHLLTSKVLQDLNLAFIL